jgi:predicted metalloprotease
MELQADCYAGVRRYHAGTMKQLDAGPAFAATPL